MPESNPIVNGVHVSSYAQRGAAGQPPAASEGVSAPPQSKSHSVPFVVLMVIALLVLFLLRAANFRFVVAANAGR